MEVANELALSELRHGDGDGDGDGEGGEQEKGGLLIPGLPNHVVIQCLMKVPRLYHGNLRSVCRCWHELVRSPEFYRWRRESGLTDACLVVLSCDHLGCAKLDFFTYDLASRQLLFKALLPPFNLSSLDVRGATGDYKLVAMNEYFVVLNWQRDGFWTEELPFLIYNILTNCWKKGAPVAVRRHSFSCGVIHGKLYVTGGMNLEGHFEHSTECYDFVKDEWRFVARLPACGPIVVEDDAVFQGKLYLRTTSQVFWVYDPLADFWVEDPCLCLNAHHQAANEGQLVATDKSLFSLTRDNTFYRFNWKEKEWQVVGRINGDISSPTSTSTTTTSSTYTVGVLSKEARRVFAFGNDIFVLASGKTGWHSRFLEDEDGSKYHRLFLGNSSYRAGAVVQA